MAIVSRVILKDDYSNKAKGVISATNQMDKSFKNVSKSSSRLKSSLDKAFNRTYDVKIRNVKDKAIRKDLQRLQSDLRKTTGKPYELSITAKTGPIKKAKQNLEAFKRTAINVKNSVKNIPVGFKGMMKARKDARNLSKQLREVTGDRHRIKIELDGENKVTQGLKGIKGRLQSLGQGIKGKVAGIGSGIGSGIAGVVGKIAKPLGIGTGLGAGAGAVATLGGGFKRLSNIQTSEAQLRGFGHDETAIEGIKGSATKSVEGTAFALDQAIQAAAGSVAAGIEPGEDLDKTMSIMANSAAAANTDLADMGSIFNKVATGGVAQAEELNQVADRGVPIFKALGEVMGVDQSEVKDLASKGKVDYQTFIDAMAVASGNAAEEMGNTVPGAFARVKGSLSKVGAGLLGGADGESGIFAMVLPALQGLSGALNNLIPVAERFGDALGQGVDKAIEVLGGLKERIEPAFEGIGEALEPIKSAFETSLLPALQQIPEAIKPVFDALKEALEPVIPVVQEVAQAVIPLFASALEYVGAVVTNVVMPAFNIVASIISNVVAPAIQGLATIISSVAVPIINGFATIISGVVVPALNLIGDIIKTVVIPAFDKIASIVGGAVKTVFEKIASIGGKVAEKFESLSTAASDVVSAFKDIPNKIASGLKGIGGRIKDAITGNATGTNYFQGGLTKINERGEEIIALPRATKIYPAGQSQKIIEKEVRSNTSNTSNNKYITVNPSIYIQSNESDEIVKELDRYFRRLGVNV